MKDNALWPEKNERAKIKMLDAINKAMDEFEGVTGFVVTALDVDMISEAYIPQPSTRLVRGNLSATAVMITSPKKSEKFLIDALDIPNVRPMWLQDHKGDNAGIRFEVEL